MMIPTLCTWTVPAVVAWACVLAPNAVAQTQIWSRSGSVTDLDRLGDVDGDGISDLVAVESESPLILSGKDGSVLATFSNVTGVMECSAAGVGDQDGDGIPDFLFGDPWYVNALLQPGGEVILVSSRTGSILYRRIVTIVGAPYCFGAGACVRGIGDADGDGKPDFAWGMEFYPTIFGMGASQATIRDQTGAELSWLLDGQFDDSFGLPVHAMAPMGDVDGDGKADVAVSCNVPLNGAEVEIRSGAANTRLRLIQSTQRGFGAALGSCGDQDGDGVRELLVATPAMPVGSISPGEVDIYSGASGALLRSLTGDTDGQLFGADVDGLDDVDGDGIADLVASSSGTGGRVDVCSGATGLVLERIDGAAAPRVRDAGDLDGDGHDDIAVVVNGRVDAWRVEPILRLDSVAPARERYDRVSSLALHGGGFVADPALAVLVDGLPAPNVVVSGYADLTCDLPAGIGAGPHDVTVTDRFGTQTLVGGLLLTPAAFVDGTPTLGATIDLRIEFETLDSSFAIVGLPPPLSIPTPPYGGTLGIFPFVPLFVVTTWPSDSYSMQFGIPNDPALLGLGVLFQSLTGPSLAGRPKDAAWTNVAAFTIQ
jgi:hypothetical protein